MQSAEVLKLDIGCGPSKRPGYLGIDCSPWPGVDYIVDMDKEQIPLPPGSASHVFSSHCLEHVREPMRFFSEIARLLRDGGEAEIWTPYAYSNGAYMFSHVNFLTEDHYSHMCILFADQYFQMTHAYWSWHEITYVVPPYIITELDAAGVPLDFALRYYKNVAGEFGVRLQMHHAPQPRVDPIRYFCTLRDGPKYRLQAPPGCSDSQVQAAILRQIQSAV